MSVEIETRNPVAFDNYLAQRRQLEESIVRPIGDFWAEPKATFLSLGGQLGKLQPPPLMSYFDSRMSLRLNELNLFFPGLPKGLDGFRILHLTDYHFDGTKRVARRLKNCISGLKVDLIATTGDHYGKYDGQPYNPAAIEQVGECTDTVESRFGPFSTLGNHDSGKVVAGLENIGFHVLVNEVATVRPDPFTVLQITGTEDPSHYFTEAANEVLKRPPVKIPDDASLFRLVLSHSADIADVAAANGHDLFLSGHTHGGQYCKKGGVPYINLLKKNLPFYAGHWHAGDMQGYTSHGIGTSFMPARANCKAEVTLITLKAG